MKKIIFAAAACMAAQFAFGIAASQAWVQQYVSNYVAASVAEVRAGTTVVATNGAVIATASAGRSFMQLIVEDFSDAALVATNCTGAATAQGVTNGCTFVWNGSGAYVNPSGTISCTSTNMTFSGVGSVSTNGVERFTGWFDAYGVLIQPHTSLSITNGTTEVHQ